MVYKVCQLNKHDFPSWGDSHGHLEVSLEEGLEVIVSWFSFPAKTKMKVEFRHLNQFFWQEITSKASIVKKRALMLWPFMEGKYVKYIS